MFTATRKTTVSDDVVQVIQDTVHYHTSEILSLILTYQLIHGEISLCPTISKKAADRRFEKLGIESEASTEIDVTSKFSRSRKNSQPLLILTV